MIYVTVTLNDNEMERVRDVAQTYWPGEQLERQLSRNEACRRLLMGRHHVASIHIAKQSESNGLNLRSTGPTARRQSHDAAVAGRPAVDPG
jgi:hypothetical protein